MIIESCEKYVEECKFKCCHFEDNYIVLYPNEFETTHLSKTHLRIIDDDYFGGKKAICMEPCSEKDFKPFDCKMYPYFFITYDNHNIKVLKGKKCPLKKGELANHKKKYLLMFKKLLNDKRFFEWQRRIEFVGYGIES